MKIYQFVQNLVKLYRHAHKQNMYIFSVLFFISLLSFVWFICGIRAASFFYKNQSNQFHLERRFNQIQIKNIITTKRTKDSKHRYAYHNNVLHFQAKRLKPGSFVEEIFRVPIL
jgi:hypothetical protein